MIGIDDDLAECFSTDEFAEPVTFTTSHGSVVIAGYFNEGSDATNVYGVDIEAVQPTFEFRTSQNVLTRGDTATRNGVGYRIERTQKTGVGVTIAYLKTT